MPDEEHVTISPEAMKRLRLFSAKYKIPMKHVVNWFIFSALDENGEPQLQSLKEALDDIITTEEFKQLIKKYYKK